MAIYRVQNHAFEPEAITVITGAYEDTLRSLGLLNGPTC